MKYQIFSFRDPLKVIKTIESTSKQNALARAGCANGEYCAVPVRESGHRIRLQEQGQPLADIDAQARQAIRDQYPNAIGDSIVVNADHAEFTTAEEETFSLPFDIDDNGNLTLGQPKKMELRPMEESFLRMGLSPISAKEAARGRETRGHYQGQDDPLVRRILETDRNDRSRINADIALTNGGKLLASPKRDAQGFYR